MKNQRILWLTLSIFLFPAIASGAILFQEGFEDTNFTSRGWYDSTNLQLSTTEHITGSTASVEYRFLQGGTTPVGSGTAIRRLFTPTNEVYVSYWVKYSANYVGSGRSYHPHEFQIMTNENTAFWGPSVSHLTAYIEQNGGKPMLAIQDSQNIDTTNINVDLTGVTENRAAAGCNGASSNEGYSLLDCYNVGEWRNAKEWKLTSVYFQDTPGQYYKNDWHHIEAYFKLNTISGGIGQSDGIVQYWYDGTLLIDHTNVILRTGQYPNMMFNQFLIAPWIGDGSPIEQTMWVDNLIVATDRASVGGNNASPTVTLSANTTSGNAPLSVNFTATATDSDGTITQYEWDLDGNGTYEAANANSTRAYTYNSAGTYNARVRVTDNGGATAISAVTITVASATGDNIPPTSSSNGSSDSGGGSGGGCGFIKGKGQVTKDGGLSMITLFLLFISLKLKKANHLLRAMVFKSAKGGIAKTMLFFIATGFTLLLFAGISHAADYYVSPTGASAWANCSGSTPLNGTSACSPSTAMTNVTAGDTVYFRGGNYYPPGVGTDGSFPSWYPRASGTSVNPIILKAYPGETVTIYQPTDGKAAIGSAQHNYIIWDGFILVKTTTTVANGVFRCYLGDNNTIRNSEFIGNIAANSQNQVGVYINDCTNTYIYNNIFRNFTGSVNTGAMWLMEDSHAYVFNNDFYDSDNGVQTKSAFSGIYAYNNFFRGVGKPFHWQQQNSTVRDFYIYNNVAVIPSGGFFLYAFDPSNEYNNTQVYNNTIYCSAGCITVYLGNSNTRTATFWNNIVYGASGTTMFARLTSGVGIPDYMDYNDYYTSGTANWRLDSTTYTTTSSWRSDTSFDTNSITSNPLFVNAGGASAADYKLQANSPARTSGRGGSYATVMGAYITGNEIIGYTSDPTLQFSSATYDVSEAGTTATITVTRSGSSTGAVTVDYATSNGTAAAGSDYTATSGTLSWADGDGASKTFTVPITNDTTIESDETISLTLSNPTGGVQLGNQSTATLTILDNDGPPILRFENSTYSAGEGAGTVTIRVRRTGSSAGAVSVNYATSNGSATAGSDYTATNGTLNWADGDTAAKSFTVSITNDTAVESSETVNIALSNPTNGAQLGTPNSVVLTITDNDSTTITSKSDRSSDEISGSGCGFVKDDNGKGPRAKGEVLTFAMMLILALAGCPARHFRNN